MLPDVIHYGAKVYNPEMLGEIINRGWVKPDGGLWTSPVNSKYGWKHWCDAEQFRDCKEEESFILRFNEGTSVYKIDCVRDLEALPMVEDFISRPIPNFEKICLEYDSIWLTKEGQWRTRHSKPSLYG